MWLVEYFSFLASCKSLLVVKSSISVLATIKLFFDIFVLGFDLNSLNVHGYNNIHYESSSCINSV